MSGESEDDDKEFDASQKRLDDARARGEIPKSQDLNTAAAYAGFAVACLLAGGSGIVAFGNAFSTVLGQAERLAPLFLHAPSAPAAAMGWAFAQPSLPLFLAPAVAVLLILFLQRALVFRVKNWRLSFRAYPRWPRPSKSLALQVWWSLPKTA